MLQFADDLRIMRKESILHSVEMRARLYPKFSSFSQANSVESFFLNLSRSVMSHTAEGGIG
jgi:hypothetical protein